MAVALGGAFELVGIGRLFRALAGISGIAVGIVQVGQIAWTVAAAISLLVRSERLTATG